MAIPPGNPVAVRALAPGRRNEGGPPPRVGTRPGARRWRRRSECDALSAYQATPEHLTLALLTTADAIASYRWNEPQIDPVLLHISATMADEVDTIAAFDAVPVP